MDNPKFLVISTITIWSFGAYLARLVSIKSQFLFLSISFSFTLITFLSYFSYLYRGSFYKRLRTTKIKYFFYGLFGYFIYWMGMIQSFRAFDSASETTILNYTWPIFTVIFTETLFRKESKKTVTHRLIESVGIALGFMSVIILATKGNIFSFDISNIKGILWGLLGGISYGVFSSFSSSVPKEEHKTFLLSSIFVSWLLMLFLGVSELHLIKTLHIKDILIVACLGFLLDGVGYILWTRANRIAYEQKVNISSLASLMFILPLLSLIIIAIFLKETQLFQSYFVLSLLLILASSVLCQKSERISSFFER